MSELIALRYLAEINPPTPAFDVYPSDREITFMPLETVWSDDRLDTSRTRPKGEVANGYVRFMLGDVLCPKVTPTFQAGRSAFLDSMPCPVGAATTEVHVLRARSGTDPRYLRYGLLSKQFLDEGVSRFQGVAGLQRVPEDYLRQFKIARVSLDEQRAISDYLDDQTRRIDQARDLRSRQINHLQEASLSLFEEAAGPEGFAFPTDVGVSVYRLPTGWFVRPLGHVLRQLTNGYVGPTRDILVDHGVRYIQSLHVKDGRIDTSKRDFFVTEAWHRERPRIHLRVGDVVIVQTGDIGQVAVVPAGLGAASCHALLIARVDEDVMSGEYLAEYLQSGFGRASMLCRATGALHPHLEGGVKQVPVVVPPKSAQESILVRIREQRRLLEETVSALRRSVALLDELKRSLITAAVAGSFDSRVSWRGDLQTAGGDSL